MRKATSKIQHFVFQKNICTKQAVFMKIQWIFQVFIDTFPFLMYTNRCVTTWRLIKFAAEHCSVGQCRRHSGGRIINRRCFQYGYQAYLSAQEAARTEGSRLPQENVHRQRPQGSGSPPRQGSRSSVLLIRKTKRAGDTLNRSVRDGRDSQRFLRPL